MFHDVLVSFAERRTMKNKNWKSVIKSKTFYEIVFISILLMTFVLWITGIFIGGGASRQFELFFASCKDFLADTLNVVGYSAERDPYYNTIYMGPAEKAYPPLVYMFFYFLSRLVNMSQYYENGYFLNMYYEPQFLIILIILLVLQMVIVYEWMRTSKSGSEFTKVACAFCLLLSAPMLFSLERANTIIITMFFVGVFLFHYNSSNRVYKEMALLSLAIAAAIKITPAILGVLLLYNKQWKEAKRTIIYGVLLFFLPFLFFDGGLENIWKMLENMQIHFRSYSITEGCTLVANLSYYFDISSKTMVTVIKILTYLICILLLFFILHFKNQWEVLMTITIILVIAPSHSGSYCVLYLFPAIIAFLNAEKHDMLDLGILLACFCIMNDVQHTALSFFLNYHMGIMLIVLVMIIKGGFAIRDKYLKMEQVRKW